MGHTIGGGLEAVLLPYLVYEENIIGAVKWMIQGL